MDLYNCWWRAAARGGEAVTDRFNKNTNHDPENPILVPSTRLYFEPLDLEGVRNVLRRDPVLGVMVQFGGQTGLNLADALAAGGTRIPGPPYRTIVLAGDRPLCAVMLHHHVNSPSPGCTPL